MHVLATQYFKPGSGSGLGFLLLAIFIYVIVRKIDSCGS